MEDARCAAEAHSDDVAAAGHVLALVAVRPPDGLQHHRGHRQGAQSQEGGHGHDHQVLGAGGGYSGLEREIELYGRASTHGAVCYSQGSTTGVTKVMICTILYVG